MITKVKHDFTDMVSFHLPKLMILFVIVAYFYMYIIFSLPIV